MSIVDALHHAYETCDRERLLQSLEPKRRYRDKLNLRCPACNEPEAFIFDAGKEIICPRSNNCGEKMDLLEWFSGRRGLTGPDFVDAAIAFCKFVGVDHEPFCKEQMAGFKLEKAKRDVFEQIMTICTEAIKVVSTDPWEETINPGLAYMRERGFTDEYTFQSGIGFLEDAARFDGVIERDALKALGLWIEVNGKLVSSFKWRSKLIIPIRARSGRVVGFHGRGVDKSDAAPKINSLGLDVSSIGAVGLDVALHGGGEVVLVEGMLDVYQLRQAGDARGACLGGAGNTLSPERWTALYELGVRSCILAFDNDDAGRKGIIAAARNYDRASFAPVVTVLDPYYLDNCKDPDEYIRRHGYANFQRLLASVEPIDRYWARSVAADFDLSVSGQRQLFIRACEDVAAGSTHPRRIQARKEYFWTEVADLLQIPADDLAELREIQLRAKQEEKRIDALKKIQYALPNDASSEEIKSVILSKLEEVDTKFKPVYVSRMLPAHEQLFADREMRKRMSQGEFIGLSQGEIPALDQHLLGLRGVIIIGGTTNTGKTILLGQLALNVLMRNPNACVLFLSLEMTPYTIRSRMLSYLAGLSDGRMLRVERGDADISEVEALRAAERQLEAFLQRLHIIQPGPDQLFDHEFILNEVAYLKNVSMTTRCMVVFDYIDVWETPEGSDRWSDNQKDQWRIKQLIRVRDANGIENPVIAVSEMRKAGQNVDEKELGPEDLMGSARKAYSADFLILWDKVSDKTLWRYYEMEIIGDRLHYNRLDKPRKFEEKEYKKQAQEIEMLREIMQEQRQGLGFMNIVKIRDGGKKGIIRHTVRWDENRVLEGFRV